MLNWSAASWSRSRVVGEDGVLSLEGEGTSSPLSATTTRDPTERGPFCREGEWGPVEVGVGVEISTTGGATETTRIAFILQIPFSYTPYPNFIN